MFGDPVIYHGLGDDCGQLFQRSVHLKRHPAGQQAAERGNKRSRRMDRVLLAAVLANYVEISVNEYPPTRLGTLWGD